MDMTYDEAFNNVYRKLDQILRQAGKRKRKDDFEPYCEPFRLLNDDEIKSIHRMEIEAVRRGQYDPISAAKLIILGPNHLVSYRALPGGFTICNILLDNKLYSGCSHCIKSDRWLPIRGKMNAFRRALEQSEGVEITGA